MVKKKSARQKHQKDSVGDTSEEELKESKFTGKVCPHIGRGLNFARVKRTLKTANIALCGGCAENAETQIEDQLEVWLCLQCGNRGCGRMSTPQHALQHFKTIHSDCHSLALSSSSGIVWCYDCDDGVNLQQSRNLRQCVEFLNKSGDNKNAVLGSAHKTSNDHQNAVKSVIKEESTSISKKADLKLADKNHKETLASKSNVKGLRNLGNTCFFNAVIQNLNQTHVLFRVLEKACSLDYSWEVPRLSLIDDVVFEETSDEPLKIAIPRQFPLANSLLQVYKLMKAPSSIKNEIVNPSPLFTEISKKCPQFKHFQEQDSHELLRQLLDGLRQDEVKRQKKAILRHFDVASIPVEEVDEDTKKLIKAYGHYASHTLVEKIFGGLFLSTVLCEECKTSSQVFEPFMDMSLPLFEEKPLRNRKGGVEQDENNEYVLNKAKKENGRPSKHQQRKLKELAKKEKKKKNKARKISETDGDLPNDKLPEEEVKEKGSDDDQEPEAEEHEADSDRQENEEVNADSNEEAKSINNLAPNKEITGSEMENHSNHISETVIHNGNNVNGELSNVDDQDLSTEATKDVSLVESDIKIERINQPNGDLCKHEKVNTESNDNSIDYKKCNVPENCESDVSILMNGSVNNDPAHNILEDLLIDEIPNEGIPEDLQQAMLGERVSEDLENCKDSLEKSQNTSTQNHKDFDLMKKSPTDSESVELLTENFQKLNVCNTLEPDERMQSLGLQVREVRIRRDSDRQGSILNSSLSPDEDTNLASCESQEDMCNDEDEEKWSCNMPESQVKEWILKSLLTLKPRVKCDPNECSIDSSLTCFTKPELLTGSNKFRCEKCTELKIAKSGNKKDVAYSNASKQFLVFSPPAILTLHLKRFQQVGMSLRKVNRFVEFPTILDLAPYCSSACLILPHMSSVKDEVLYSLYGVVEHSGRMSSGHYTAYVKVTKRTLNENFMCQLPLNSSSNLEQLLQKFSNIGSEKVVNSDGPSSANDYHWYYISDAHVREVSEAQVMKCQAYLLFYERIK